MSLYQNFTYKADGSSLIGDGDFISSATGTAFEKTSGDVFTKVANNIFDKAVRKIISQTEMDVRYLNATGDGTLSGDLLPATDNTYDLGSSSKRFNELFAAYVRTTDIAVAGSVLPTADNVSNIGSAGLRFNTIYAQQFLGQASAASTIYSTEGDGNGNYFLTFIPSSGTGNQSVYHDNEIYVNPATNTLVCANFSGNAASASTIYSTEGDGNGNYYLSFVAGSGSGNQNMNHDNEITVNPATNTITCTNFAGNASSSTYSDYTYVTRDDSTNTSYYLNFSGIGSAQQRIRNDANLSYNPYTNTLYAGTFSGTFAGVASNATNSTYSDYTYVTRDDGTNGTYYINFSGIGDGQQRMRNDGGLYYNPAINTLYTGTFNGTATSARYADLAEKYESDVQYEVGTVVEIGGDKEITLFQGGALAGVISTQPGLMLNAEAGDGYQYVALKGKVPVKCHGQVKKGQYCVAFEDGKVIGVNKTDLLEAEKLNIVGVALSHSDNDVVMVKV